ncbi:MAG: hypothetical protein KDC91_10755, partial [Flavobacteriaceae bacterium]|nr:hypothetical protein [Flavobacteriaceae bacterium]
MLKRFFMVAFFLKGFLLSSQVGINTTSPNAILDISASNAATPNNTDGILIPKIDAFPAVNPGAAQNGMMVFLTTTIGVNTPGFYYWEQATTSWKSVGSGAKKINDLSDGKSDITGYSTYLGTGSGQSDASPSTTFNTGLGFNTLFSNTTGASNVAIGHESILNNTTGNENIGVGVASLYSNTTGQRNLSMGWTSMYNNTIGSNNIALGYRTLSSNTASSNLAIGNESLLNNTTGSLNL